MLNIVEIVAMENGAHRNQSFEFPIAFSDIPDGWALLPPDLPVENFPFGEIEVEEVEGVKVVTKWAPLPIPEPEPEPEAAPTEMEQLRADVDFLAVMTGVEL